MRNSKFWILFLAMAPIQVWGAFSVWGAIIAAAATLASTLMSQKAAREKERRDKLEAAEANKYENQIDATKGLAGGQRSSMQSLLDSYKSSFLS